MVGPGPREEYDWDGSQEQEESDSHWIEHEHVVPPAVNEGSSLDATSMTS